MPLLSGVRHSMPQVFFIVSDVSDIRPGDRLFYRVHFIHFLAWSPPFYSVGCVGFSAPSSWSICQGVGSGVQGVGSGSHASTMTGQGSAMTGQGARSTGQGSGVIFQTRGAGVQASNDADQSGASAGRCFLFARGFLPVIGQFCRVRLRTARRTARPLR
jgi:hypothetical protein